MAAKREGIATNDANSGRPHPEPQIAPPPWQRLPDRQGRRRREPISREAIVTAAIRLLDREGLAALSMRRLAEELGTGAASLYWHVGSKDGLLDLVFDELIGEEQVPEADPSRWQEQLKDIARAQRRISLRHPYLVRISIGRIPMGPNALRFSERVIAILRAGGLPPRLAVQGYLLLIATVNGFTVDETGVDDDGPAGPDGPDGNAPPSDPARRQEAADMARDYVASLPAGQFPNMVALADEFAFADADERFEMLIDIFVDGLARRAAVSSRRDRAAPSAH
jgi:AcrR family transcriptional regulator